MKLKVTITEITHDDLVELFSTAFYGSSWLRCNYHCDDNDETVRHTDEDCYEDVLAKCLLAGKEIEISDLNACSENESNGSKLKHYWNDMDEEMVYKVSLKDITKALEKMITKNGWPAKCAMSLINADDGEFDQPQAECIIQYILWEDEIYG